MCVRHLVRSRRGEPVDPSRPCVGRAAAAHGHGRLRSEDRRAAHPERAGSLRHQGGLVELPTAWCNNDWPFFGFSAVPPVGNGIWSQEDVFEVWKEEFEGAWEEGGFFNLMGHPQVVGRPSRMRMVSRLLELILGKGDVWIARPIEIAEHYLSQR